MQRRFSEVDVFSSEPYRGNPLVVVHDAEGIVDEELQAFAAWAAVSETTFLLAPTRPEADYRVRIFAPSRELPFAGHPTLGSCRAWLEAGGQPADERRIVQECSVGLVVVRPGLAGGLAFAAPPLLRSGAVDDVTLDEALRQLGIDRASVVDSAWIDNGPGWLGLQVGSTAELAALRIPAAEPSIGVVALCPPGSAYAYELRAFFADGTTVVEDPVTGSLHASMAQWLTARGLVRPPYLAAQGASLGRAGEVLIELDADGSLWVGGLATVRISGQLEL